MSWCSRLISKTRVRRASGFAFLLAMSSCMLVLASCSPALLNDPTADFDDYRERLSKVLGIKFEQPPELPETLNPRYPPRRALRLEGSEQSISILDIFTLDACTLGQLVAERNSVLGKVMAPSSVWVYEQAFLASIDQCLELLAEEEDEAGLIADLKKVRKVKRAEIGVPRWNATLASEEFQALFSPSEQILPADFSVSEGQALTRALARLHSYVAGSDTAAVEGLEDINSTLLAYSLLGQVLLSVENMTVELQSLSNVLEGFAADLRCGRVKLTDDNRKIALNVLRVVYAERIQPYLSELQKAAYQWILPIASIARESGKAEKPELFTGFAQRYLDTEGGVWAEYQSATRRHAKLWTGIRDQPAISEPASGCSE